MTAAVCCARSLFTQKKVTVQGKSLSFPKVLTLQTGDSEKLSLGRGTNPSTPLNFRCLTHVHLFTEIQGTREKSVCSTSLLDEVTRSCMCLSGPILLKGSQGWTAGGQLMGGQIPQRKVFLAHHHYEAPKVKLHSAITNLMLQE